MAAMMEPTVFATEWKCGDTLKPTTKAGKIVNEIQACKVKKQKRSISMQIPHRDHDFKFFEKRDGYNCGKLLKLHKRQGMAGMDGHAPSGVDQFNVIAPKPGQQAYARVSAGMYNELFYSQAAKRQVKDFEGVVAFTNLFFSGLMTVGAQHGVGCTL